MERPLRVLILTHNVVRKGGAYYRGLSLARGLVARGHEVTLMGIAAHNRVRFIEETEQGVTIVHSPDLLWGIGRTGWDPWDTLCRILWLRRRHFDVVYTVDTRPAVVLPALYARRRHGSRFIADWTDWWGRGGASSERSDWFSRTVMAPIELYFEEAFRPGADGTVVISRALHGRARGLGIPHPRILHLPTGCDTHAIASLPMQDARERLGLKQDAVYLGYLGNIYQRDADLLVDAMRRLETGRHAVLLMVGGARPRIDAEFARSGRLLQTGHVPFADMVTYVCACDVLLLPLSASLANRGRWPSKINDYLAAGRAVVASAVGDLVDLYRQQPFGRLAGPTAADFAQCIDEMLADMEITACIGRSNRAYAESGLSQASAARKLETFLWSINGDGMAEPEGVRQA
jgi:glycosyltransferase involved in cell wall biosynthesis